MPTAIRYLALDFLSLSKAGEILGDDMLLLASDVPGYLKEELACLVEELNCIIYYILLCLEGDRSGRKACHISLFTVAHIGLFVSRTDPDEDSLLWSVPPPRMAAHAIQGEAVRKRKMRIFLPSLWSVTTP